MKAVKTDSKNRYRLRFAPSPTGFLHVGGARTAIFNWLLARKHNGSFLLRIEDTDKSRSTAEAEQQILSALQWLGIDWDGEIYFQSRHQQRHIDVAKELLEQGKAYRCFCTKEELDEKRRRAEVQKVNQRYDGTCRNLSDKQIEQNLADKKPFSLRFKVEPGEVVYTDKIHGITQIDNNTLDDFIILRTDGSPTYQLAVVTDDHDMGITLVLRGDDHIANTNKQILLYRALNWPVPEFGHIPLILGSNKVRLSKRHGATSVSEFQQKGVLAEALFNYLCLLGWSPGDDKEIMHKEELLEKFDIFRINNSAAVFDIQKLFWINTKYLANLPFEQVWSDVQEELSRKKRIVPKEEEERFRLLVSLLQGRSKTMAELFDALNIYFDAPSAYNEKGVKKFFLKGQPEILLTDLSRQLTMLSDTFFSDLDEIDKYIRDFAQGKEIAAAKVIHPLRLALTGSTASPGIFEVVHILGKEKVIKRLNAAIQFIKETQAG